MSASTASGAEDPNPSPGLSEGAGEAPRAAAAPRMLLTDGQWRTEATLLGWLGVEFVRVVQPSDSQATVRYVNTVESNARALAGGNGRLYISLLRDQLRWIRLQPSGMGELR